MKKILTTIIALALTIISFAQIPSNIPLNGLVGWYPFNGNAHDESGTGNNGTVNGATLTNDRFGKTDSSYYFDGVNSYITIPNSSSLNFDALNDSYTFSIWCQSDDPVTGSTPSARLLEKRDGGPNDDPITMQIFNDTLDAFASDASHDLLLQYRGVFNSQWHLVTFVVNNTDKNLKGYLDGILVDSVTNTLTGTAGNQGDIVIGNSYTFIRPFHGNIDDIGIWSRALNKTEITKLYNPSIAGISFKTDLQPLEIYPNPVSSNLFITSSANQIELKDLLGRTIYQQVITEKQTIINVRQLPAGIYFAVLRNEDGNTAVKKFVKE